MYKKQQPSPPTAEESKHLSFSRQLLPEDVSKASGYNPLTNAFVSSHLETVKLQQGHADALRKSMAAAAKSRSKARLLEGLSMMYD